MRDPLSEIDLIKSKAPGQGDTVAPGDYVNYIITVRNRGQARVNNLIVEDHFPQGLELADSNWRLLPGQTRIARFNETFSLNAGQERQIPIRFRVAQNASGKLQNLAVVGPQDPDNPDGPLDPETPPSCDDEDEVGTPEGCEEIIVEESACT